jgi:hypothetical protein
VESKRGKILRRRGVHHFDGYEEIRDNEIWENLIFQIEFLFVFSWIKGKQMLSLLHKSEYTVLEFLFMLLKNKLFISYMLKSNLCFSLTQDAYI